ncbi:MAG: sensor histidine kinase [Opitutales bacterium]
MLRSLKLRIAVLTSLITTSIVVAGAALMLKNIRNTKLERVDEEIKLLAITSIPKIFESRPSRDRDRPRPRIPQSEIDLPDDFWITITLNKNTTTFHTPNTPEAWFDEFPLDAVQQENPFLSKQQRFPMGRFFGSPPQDRGGPRGREGLPERLIENIQFDSIKLANSRIRVGKISTESDYQLNFVKDLSLLRAEMEEIEKSIYQTIPLFILLTITASAFLSTRALSAFRKLSGNIDQVSGAGLNARLQPQKLPSEFIPLVDSINEMLERIDRSFNQANRFAADASHELRTPLTILQGHLEKLIQTEPDSTNQRQEEYANLLEEVNRLQRLSAQLLFLARSDSGHFKIERNPVAISEELGELIEDYRDLYPECSFTFASPENLSVSADWPLLQQAIANLLTNAVNYGEAPNEVCLKISESDSIVRIQVENTGSKIPEETAKRLFDRFYRAEDSRARTSFSSGTGLGLSLAKECVKAHGGTIRYQGNNQGMNVFEIRLPH